MWQSHTKLFAIFLPNNQRRPKVGWLFGRGETYRTKSRVCLSADKPELVSGLASGKMSLDAVVGDTGIEPVTSPM